MGATREITDTAELTRLLGEPTPAARDKARDRLHRRDVEWLAATPFCVLATAAADGTCDASPKGDPAGSLVHVLDERTIALAERPGNRRADGYRNVISNPQVGLLFLIPGRGDTLRINGRARVLSDAPYADELVVKGHRPVLFLEVAIEQIFFHCAKAFLRSGLWQPETWDPEVLPRRAVLAKETERPQTPLADLDRHYGPEYGRGLYG